MEQGIEALKQTYPVEGIEPKREIEKREAVILPFPKTYEGYKNLLGGTLSQEEYEDVLKSAAEGRTFNLARTSQANFMAETSGITLSPETVTVYGILRDERPDPAKEYSGMSDQKLLAEALRIVGDTDSLTTFIEKYPNIFKSKF